MKRLVGGEYLLDLSSIELEESEDGSTKTNITDADVLAQLTNLKKYVKNPEMAKPVWVKLKNGENDELIIARGTFAVVDTGEFEICVQLDGYKLVIYIEFTQVTLEDNTPIDDWFIDTNDAKYLFTSDAQNIGAILSTGEIPNAKPIYYHPIYVTQTITDSLVRASFVIIDNNATPYTWSTFLAKIKDLMDNGAFIQVNGFFEKSGGVYDLFIGLKENDKYICYGNDYQGAREQLNLENVTVSTFYDGVNKIN